MSEVFRSSGDLLADRRYDYAMAARRDGDLAASADLIAQALEIAPGWAAGWFALGEVERDRGHREAAIAAFRAAADHDLKDALGARLMLARLGVDTGDGGELAAMSPAYVATLFDQYAPRFDWALREKLAYRGPEILVEAVGRATAAAGRPFRFRRMFDLGCGTGLAAEAFAPHADAIDGVDLSARMVEIARAKRLYASLEAGDLTAFLDGRAAGAADLVVAADVFVYCADLKPVLAAAARALEPQGLIAFTVETHDGEGVVLGAGLRYGHARAHLETLLAAAPFRVLVLEPASSRHEGGRPVPGLVAVAARLG